MAIDVYVCVCIYIGFQETPQFRILVFLYPWKWTEIILSFLRLHPCAASFPAPLTEETVSTLLCSFSSFVID